MDKTKEKKRILRAELIIVAVLVLGIGLISMLSSRQTVSSEAEKWASGQDLDGKVFVCTVGSVYEQIIKENFPSSDILYVQDWSDEALFVLQGKADALIAERSSMDVMVVEYPELVNLPETVGYSEFRWTLQKDELGNRLTRELNDFLALPGMDEELKEMYKKWEDPDKAPDHVESYPMEREERGEITIVTSLDWMPVCYVKNGNPCGYFIDLAMRFCAYEGYVPKFEYVDIQSAVAGFNTGKYDLLCYGCVYSEDEAQSANFSDVLCSEPVYAVIKESNYLYAEPKDKGNKSFFAGLKNSFIKNFITEDRWKMLLSGLGVTIGLSLFSGLLGTLLGALICAMRMSKNSFATAFARLYIKLIQGIPIMVLLMILFYVIFAHSRLTAFVVCVIGFSLDFSAYVSEIFRSGIEAVPPGQKRAAIALGFKKREAFATVVLPQAMLHIVPVYLGQFISMVKMTSVSGYISVQDITKVSDIIRARTLEAFFPLILSAVIYFMVAWFLTIGLRRMEKMISPETRKREVKGVVDHAP